MKKTIKLADFRVNSRQMAEQSWGTGGTSVYKTNRKNINWFSCSGHGGLVIDSKDLTPAEYAILSQYQKPEKMNILTGFKNGEKFVLASSSPFSFRSKRVTYPAIYTSVQWEAHDFFMFEEDCSWCIPVLFIDLDTTAGSPNTKEDIKKQAEQTFNDWILPYQNKTA